MTGVQTCALPICLAAVLRGQLGQAEFDQLLIKYRPNLLPAIGVDGYDYLPQLLAQYLDGGKT